MSDYKVKPVVIGADTFEEGWQPDPSKRQMFKIDVSKDEFLRDGEFDYYVNKDKRLQTETLWIGGMMKWVVNTCFMVVDGSYVDENNREVLTGDDFSIFIFYHVMNDPTHLTLLGKLKDDCKLAKRLKPMFRAFISNVA